MVKIKSNRKSSRNSRSSRSSRSSRKSSRSSSSSKNIKINKTNIIEALKYAFNSNYSNIKINNEILKEYNKLINKNKNNILFSNKKNNLNALKILILIINFFNINKQIGGSSNDCPICFNNLNDSPIITTNCNHKFHAECLQSWQLIRNTCPLCRANLDPAAGPAPVPPAPIPPAPPAPAPPAPPVVQLRRLTTFVNRNRLQEEIRRNTQIRNAIRYSGLSIQYILLILSIINVSELEIYNMIMNFVTMFGVHALMNFLRDLFN